MGTVEVVGSYTVTAKESMDIWGSSSAAVGLSLVFSSLVFGLSHYYQGSSGAISATMVGFFIGVVFILSEFNLWLVILIHGFIDSVQLILIFANKDHDIRNWIARKGSVMMIEDLLHHIQKAISNENV